MEKLHKGMITDEQIEKLEAAQAIIDEITSDAATYCPKGYPELLELATAAKRAVRILTVETVQVKARQYAMWDVLQDILNRD